jgi:hypothetical protein
LIAALAAAALVALSLPISASARPDDDAVLSPLGMSIANPPNPVLGADGLNHLAMDGPSPLQSNGLRFVFKRFTGQGLVTNIGPVQQGAQAQIAPSLVGRFKARMPLGDELIAFGGS